VRQNAGPGTPSLDGDLWLVILEVNWEHSIGDFTFLSMLLNRRMQPAAAARQARAVSPYIGDSVPAGSPFPPLGLGVVER